MESKPQQRPRIYYIDNLRIFLTCLVVLHHLAITYGAPGGWFYNESQAEFPEIIPFSMFVATNQAFFMGMFFFISAYFLPASLLKKGIGQFVKDRLRRLGIPTLLFFFLLFPLTVFIRNKYILDEDITYLDYITHSKVFGIGPMWFVAALLIFNLIYLISSQLKNKIFTKKAIPSPSAKLLVGIAILIGLGQFIIRFWYPVGRTFSIFQFQLGHFLQYIVLFAVGITAYKNDWMSNIHFKMGLNWFIFAQILIFVGFPTIFILGGAAENGPESFMGGTSWKSLVYCIWEQLIGLSMIIGLLGIFNKRFNRQGKFAKKLSASAYAVYIIHPPILLLISFIFISFNIPQLWKFIVLTPICLIACFSIAYIFKKLPLLKQIL